jgi:hypothetical protein
MKIILTKIAFAAKRSVNLNPSAHNKVLLANIIFSEMGQKKLEDGMREFLEDIGGNEEWIVDVGLIVAARSKNQKLAERVFGALVGLFPKSPRVANLHAKVIAKKGNQAALYRAIDICRRTIQDLEDNVHSRMQLITYLILKGDDASMEEATRELNRREADFGVDQHSMLLRQLLSQRDPRAKELRSLLRIASPVSRDTDKPRLLPQISEHSSSLLHLPASISIGGELRKCEFVIRKMPGPSLLAAKERLKEIIATNPTFAYAQLLAARHADWVRSDIHLDAFPAAFERALRSGDLALLARLGAKEKKLEALCIVARSLR